LFDPLWVRDPIESDEVEERQQKRVAAGGEQMRLYLGPELIKSKNRLRKRP
jgi:hypothetical protein